MVPPLEIVTTTYNSGSSLEEAHTQVSVEIKPARLLIPLHWIEQPQHQLQPNENDQSKNINNNISIIKQMIKAISVVAIPIDNMRFRYSDFMGIRGTEVNALLSSIEDKCKQKLDNDIELTAAVHVFNTWRSGYVVVGVWITDKRIAHSQLQIPEDLYSHTTFDSLANLIEPQVQQAITSATTPLYTRPVRTYSPPGRSSYGRSSYGRPIRPRSRPMLSTPYGSIIRHRREHYGGRLIESSDYYEEECLSRNQTGKSSHTGKSYSEDQSKKHIKKDISKDGLYRKALGKTRSKNMKNARLTRTWE
jgi:hypothetical protein